MELQSLSRRYFKRNKEENKFEKNYYDTLLKVSDNLDKLSILSLEFEYLHHINPKVRSALSDVQSTIGTAHNDIY